MEVPEGFIDISIAKDKGVLKKIIHEGSGEATPQKGSVVYVHYVGTLFGGPKDGDKFDSSKDRGDKFSFTIGEGQVIKAWDEGVATMRKGEICELICSPGYAYGDKDSGSIPANSTLKFEVELFEWKGKDISPNKDATLTQSIIVPGQGYDSPKDCVPVKISLTGSYNDVVFDERDVEFEIGDYENNNIVAGIEMAVKKMKKNERSLFEIHAEHAFGATGNTGFNIPGNATVTYEITLKDFEKLKDSYSIDACKDKLQYSENFKERANEKFQLGKYRYATKLYEKATSYIEYETDFSEEEDKTARRILLLSLRLNLALCHLKLEDGVAAMAESEKALEIESDNEKGLYRRGLALVMKGDYEEARKAFKAVLARNGGNRQAAAQAKSCDAKIKESYDQEKKLYRTMMSKIGQGVAASAAATAPATAGDDTVQENGATEPHA